MEEKGPVGRLHNVIIFIVGLYREGRSLRRYVIGRIQNRLILAILI